jgi:hypothetical protein
MNSLLVALIVGALAWLYMRRLNQWRAQRRAQARAAEEPQEPQETSTMPRLGSPGSITRDQIAALRENDFEPSRMWSREEADLVLDSVRYLRAVIREETGDTDAPVEVQNKILAFILGDEPLRDYVMSWALNRTREEEAASSVRLEDNEHHRRIAEFVARLWEKG